MSLCPGVQQTDTRIPVYLTSIPEQGVAAWLVEGEAAAPGPIAERFTVNAAHPIGCACCAPRSAAAQALGRLFLRRARGEVAWFDCVQAVTHTPSGRAAVLACLTEDVLAQARFRVVTG
jgi:hypothetical protein